MFRSKQIFMHQLWFPCPLPS